MLGQIGIWDGLLGHLSVGWSRLVGGGGPSGAVCGGGRLCSSLQVDMEESKIRKVKSKLKKNVYSFILFM